MSGKLPSLSVTQGIATLCLQRPEQANRLGNADLEMLLSHFQAIDDDPSIRVVILRAGGKHFCAGYHLGDLESGGDDGRFEAVAQGLEALRPVTIASVQGGAYGGASDLLLACDFRIGTLAAEVAMPAARFGLHLYGSLLERYVSRLGLNAAKRMILSAEKLDAQEMLHLGFLTHLVEVESELDARVEALAERLEGMAPLAMSGMKYHLNSIAAGHLSPESLARDIQRCAESQDMSEGLQALQEGRRPHFLGC